MEYRNFLLASLRADDAAVLAPRLKEVTLTFGQVLFEPDDELHTLYFPSSACISVVAQMQDGKTLEIATIGRESAGGLLDVMSGARSGTRQFIQISGTALTLPAPLFRARMAQSPELLHLALSHVRATVRQAETSLACNLAHTADGRLARWLLMTQDRVGSPTFPLTQDLMAIMTGVQRSTVSQLAHALKTAGVIHYARGQVTVVDRQRLIDSACECYGTVNQLFEDLRGKTPPH